MIAMLVFQLAILIFSVIVHEVSHGYVAEHLGDPTARLAGRLTFNPLSHLDPVGSFLLPVALWFLTGGQFVFGWAKPVPYNPMNLKDPIGGGAKIAAAGPIANLTIAVLFGILLRSSYIVSFVPPFLGELFGMIIYVNILLAVFNLVPIPPLDGSKVLFALLPKTKANFHFAAMLERYGVVLLLAFIFFGFQFIVPIVNAIFVLIAGQPAAGL